MSRSLPPEILELQLSQVDLLLAMYPGDAVLEPSHEPVLESLREWSATDSQIPLPSPSALSISLDLRISEAVDSASDAYSIQLDLSAPICWDGVEPLIDPPPIRARIKQPAWMSKAEVSKISTELPDEDVLTVIEHIKEECQRYLISAREAAQAQTLTADSGPLVRVWFYFPSISTRSKRDDFINHGPAYGLTGFLLAGKPGILCLEGGSRSIDEFMKFIKTDSWGDIPAHHKKVSERYRETQNVKRVFVDVQEITDLVGERRGERANRGDMKAVEAWLEERGLGDAFKKILM